VIGKLPKFLNFSAVRGSRFRLLVAMFLLALPLVAGIWAFAGFAGRSGEQRAEAQLDTVLRAALQAYNGELVSAGSRAASTAARRDVQLALLRGERAQLARIAKTVPRIAFVPRRGPALGLTRGLAARRSVEVVVGRHPVGRVVAFILLDRGLLRRLAAGSRLPAGDRLVFRRDLPTTVTLDGSRYHAAAARLRDGDRRIALVALAPSARIEGAGSRLRDRVLVTGFVTLGCLFLLIYLVAPAIAHGRLLRRQRDQAARVLSHLAEGVFLVDDGGIVRLWNDSAEAITGLAADTVRGRRAVDALPGWAALRNRIPVGDDRPRATTLSVELPGRMLWLSISGVRFSDGVVYAFRDLTEEHKLEQMRSDFVATVSHELRTPLASIHGAAVTLASLGGELGPVVHERLLGIVVEQSERLSELVEQILLAAQLDSGGLRLDREGFDAADVAREVISSSRPRIPAAVTVSLAAPPESPVVALGDPGRARHVLGNLLDNAIKYSPAGGRIDLIIAPEEDRLRFTVRDEGLGIPPAEQERIFEKFYRLDAPMSRGVGGSGLGLYICRELVTRMDGRIWVSSEPGRGSSFSFELPRVDEPVAALTAIR
jgi:two-component system, OmpR family, phosphate regulon sensor histidine kinase PhoR